MKYNFREVEPKWQTRWEAEKIFHAEDISDKPKFYGLVEFPYPSGAGMHVGHIKAYTGLEIVSRKRRMTLSDSRPKIMRSRPTSIRVSSRTRISSTSANS